MKYRIIEAAILIVIAVFASGCYTNFPDCLDFDAQLEELMLGHYVYCAGVTDLSGHTTYFPIQGRHPVGPGLEPGLNTSQPSSDFDCGTSVNGQAPLPHPKSEAAVPPSASASLSAARHSTAARPHAAGPVYRPYGYNNGYVPPPVVNPMIPAPVISNGSLAVPDCAPNAPDVLFVNHLHNTVTRMATCPFAIKAVIPLASRPLQVAVTPDGTTALVTSFDNAVNFVDLASNTVSYTLQTDPSINPAGVAISPDGKRAYVGSFNNFNAVILVIDLNSRTVVTTFPALDAWPQALYTTPDGSQLWVSFPFEDHITIFDTLTDSQTASRSVAQPSGIAFNSTGTRAYVASGFGPGAVVAFDTATLKQIASYNVGSYPVDVTVLGTGQYVMVDNFGSANQSLVDTTTGKVFTTQPNSGVTSANGMVLLP